MQPPSEINVNPFREDRVWVWQLIRSMRLLLNGVAIAFAPFPLIVSLLGGLLLCGLSSSDATPAPTTLNPSEYFGSPSVFSVGRIIRFDRVLGMPWETPRSTRSIILAAVRIVSLTGILSLIATFTAREVARRSVGASATCGEGVSNWWGWAKAFLLLSIFCGLLILLERLFMMVAAPRGLGVYVGTAFLPVFAPLAMLLGFFWLIAMQFWPLLVATRCVERCDSFGAISRMVSYLTVGFWNCWFYLAVLMFLVTVVHQVFELISAAGIPTTSLGRDEELTLLIAWGQTWLRTAIQLSVVGVESTLIVLCLRERVDRVPLDSPEVFDRTGIRDPFPVVGLAALRPEDTMSGSTAP